MTVPVLEVRDLAVSFDGFKALDGVNLVVERGRAAFPHRPERRREDDLVDCVTGPDEGRPAARSASAVVRSAA